jgi:hypothetical protein
MLAKMFKVHINLTLRIITQETSDNVQGFENLATWMKNLKPILLEVNEVKTKGIGVNIISFLERLEV